MPTDCLSYKETNYFTPLIIDYLDQKESLKPFYNRFPLLDNFEAQIQEKQSFFTSAKRRVLVEVLQEQYKDLQISEAVKEHISLLEKDNTFTVTTGHQLNLFTGPLYFLYKIVSTINLAKDLQKKYPTSNFVPIYWMATEDHDFAEINYFNLNGKKFKWNSTQATVEKDAVGNLNTSGLDEVLTLFSSEIGGGRNADFLKELFSKAYIEHDNLTDATRFLANELFKEYGLVILDADDKHLKREFLPYLEKEIFEKVSENSTTPAANKLKQLGYTVQVNPRDLSNFSIDEFILL